MPREECIFLGCLYTRVGSRMRLVTVTFGKILDDSNTDTRYFVKLETKHQTRFISKKIFCPLDFCGAEKGQYTTSSVFCGPSCVKTYVYVALLLKDGKGICLYAKNGADSVISRYRSTILEHLGHVQEWCLVAKEGPDITKNDHLTLTITRWSLVISKSHRLTPVCIVSYPLHQCQYSEYEESRKRLKIKIHAGNGEVYYYEFATSFCREISEEISKHLRSESTKNRPLPAPPVPPKASRNITKPIPEERLDSSDAETDEPPPPPPCVRPKFSRSQSQDNLCAITKMNNVSAKRSIMDILDAHSSDIYYNCKNLMEIIKADANRKRKRKNHTDGIIYWIKQCHRDQKFREDDNYSSLEISYTLQKILDGVLPEHDTLGLHWKEAAKLFTYLSCVNVEVSGDWRMLAEKIGLLYQDIGIIESFSSAYRKWPTEVILLHWQFLHNKSPSVRRIKPCTKVQLLEFLRDIGRDDITLMLTSQTNSGTDASAKASPS